MTNDLCVFKNTKNISEIRRQCNKKKKGFNYWFSGAFDLFFGRGGEVEGGRGSLLFFHVFRTPLLAGFRCERGHPYSYRASFQLTTTFKPTENQSLMRVGNNSRLEVIERDSRTETSERAFFPLACPPRASRSSLRPYYLQAPAKQSNHRFTVRNLHFPTGQTVA